METRRLGILSVNLPPDRLRLQPWRYLTDLTRALREIGHDASLVVPAAESTSAIDVPVIRSGRPEDFEESRRVQALLRELKLDGGILRLSAGFLGSTKRPPPADLRPLVGAFLRPLHEGSTLLRRYLNPLMLFEGSLDLHHAAMFLSRKRGWGSVASHVRRFTFLWEADRMAGVRAGLPADRCSVVPHPFDPFFLERGPAGLAARLAGIPPSPRRVAYAGPEEYSRGLRDFLGLARELPAEPRVQLVALVRWKGEPQVRTKLIGTHNLVVVKGDLTREELRTVYQSASVAVFPYRFVRTGLPLVALEAVAAGTPVVTTRVHPFRAMEGRTGLRFADRGDRSGLARAVTAILEGGEREAISRENAAWINRTPDWPQVARTYAGLLAG